MAFEYSKLKGKIIEVYGSQKEFARAMKWSQRTLSLKLNNERAWKQTDIINALALLGIPGESVSEYFFCSKSSIG